jgi:hypothetical protein
MQRLASPFVISNAVRQVAVPSLRVGQIDSGARIKWLGFPRWTSCHRYWPVAALSFCDTRTDTTLARLMITPF